MISRWNILGLLFAIRTAMAIQYQSVAAVAPLMVERYGVGIADIGLLIGLYLAPGIVLALPGGKVGAVYGDKRCVLAGLALMLIGGFVMMAAPTWGWQIAGRLLAGVGGAFLNVLMAKMVADWFAGREIATAMAVFVNSWPVGIALGLLILPPIAVNEGVTAVFSTCAVLVAFGLVALAIWYRDPPAAGPATGGGLSAYAVGAVVCAGLAWSLYNAGFAMVFGFGPAMLVARGWTLEAAGSTISLALWAVAISVPAGGFFADRLQRPIATIIGGSLLFAILMLVVTRTQSTALAFLALGLVAGLPAGAIMSLPARLLDASTRAVGMGLYFTVFYAGMVAGPFVGGLIADWSGSPAAPFDFGAALILATCACIVPHLVLARRSRAAAMPA